MHGELVCPWMGQIFLILIPKLPINYKRTIIPFHLKHTQGGIFWKVEGMEKHEKWG